MGRNKGLAPQSVSSPCRTGRGALRWPILPLVALAIGVTCAANAAAVRAQAVQADAPPAREQLALAVDAQQRALAEQFAKLEELFIRLSELEGDSNPTRASLLQQAAQLSKQLATQQRLNVAADYLAKGQFTRALQEQQAAKENLQQLYELLQRENRSQRLDDEQQRIEQLIKEVQRISRLQRSLRGRTEAGQDASEAAEEQQSLRKSAAELEKAFGSQAAEDPSGEAGENPPQKSAEPQPEQAASGEPSDQPNQSDRGDAGEPQDQPSSESDPRSGETPKDGDAAGKDDGKDAQEGNRSEEGSSEPQPESQQGEPSSENRPSGEEMDPNRSGDPQGSSGDPQDSSSEQTPSEGQPSEGQPQQQQPADPSQGGDQSSQSSGDSTEKQQPQSPEQRAEQQLQQAQKRMQQASQKLREAERSAGVQEQRAAEEALAKAIEELQRILRQMREEEAERQLADLETRIRRMLTMQTKILTQTEQYAAATDGLDSRQIEMQAVKLAIDQRKVLIESQRAMLLLEEEGSSMAFPEAMRQVTEDMALLVEFFNRNRIDSGNVSLQQQVVATLEELLESLTAAQEALEKKKEEQQKGNQSGGPSQSQEQPLVDQLAELRLIKTLQLRINKRTLLLAEQAQTVEDPRGDVAEPLQAQQLRELATRQERLEQVIRDLLLERARK